MELNHPLREQVDLEVERRLSKKIKLYGEYVPTLVLRGETKEEVLSEMLAEVYLEKMVLEEQLEEIRLNELVSE